MQRAPAVMIVLLAILMIFAVPAADGGLLEKYANMPGNVYHGRYTRDVQGPELLIPRRVLEDGTFSTYSLSNFYNRYETGERGKRSAGTADDKLHLVLSFRGIDHHVELSPYHEFISPDMVVETRGPGVSKNLDGLKFRRASDRQCHYRGHIRGHPYSRAALSLCNGVAGYIQTNHGRYFIEPVYQAEPEVDGQHVHIAYKRNAPHERKIRSSNVTRRHCATDDNWEAAWAEQLAKREMRLLEDDAYAARRAAAEIITSGTHSIHRYIEIGLIADRRFLDFHNNTDYEQYLLTIMNMVSDYYHDTSVGNQIDVILVRLVYLEKEKEEIDLLISPMAEETLESFAKWAEKINPKDDQHPNHFDIGVLVTRYDICSERINCELMGLANVAVACDPAKSACINEDAGLLLGIVITHEVGHVLGCAHDEPEVSGCESKDATDDSFYLMSPIVFLFTIRWSTCSRKYITSFLESGLGECLNDNPKNPPERLRYPNMLPGAMYDATFQCQLTMPGSSVCPQVQDTCEKLWCFSNETCVTYGAPKADGSKCGENKWCIHKVCVDMGSRPAARDGGWGSWSPFGVCSRTCGGGFKFSERECDSPVPANSGRYCIGERKKYQICNTTQCSSYDKIDVLGDGLHTWSPWKPQPGTHDVDPCVLYCINEKNSYTKLAPLVNDSTPCKPRTNYMCLFGQCRKVGCDWQFDSDAIEDVCGICQGDGTRCNKVKGEYTALPPKPGYTKIVEIPRKARTIKILEKKPCQNTLAVKYTKNDSYCLNEKFQEYLSGEYDCAGTMIFYTHPETNKEIIEMKGPLAEDIEIQYVFYKRDENPGIDYSYYMDSVNATRTPEYVWEFVEWSECDKKCDGGTMKSEPNCIEKGAGRVSPNFCKAIPRPEVKSRVCNQQSCGAKWRVSQWSKCDACDGNKGTKHRRVQCVRPSSRQGEDDVQANLDACKGRVPKQKEECIGTTPCKLMCKTRKAPFAPSSAEKELDNANDEMVKLSPGNQRRMIDRIVDLGLARYLDKSRERSHEVVDKLEGTSAARDLRQLLYDWARTNEEKRKRTCLAEEERRLFTTLKPGSVIKDVIPLENVVILEAPYTDELLQANLSDRAFQEGGDLVGVGIDMSRKKVYKGADAVRLLDKMRIGHHNATKSRRSIRPEELNSSVKATPERRR